mmetsp:Transcript_99330/g.206907  ORF Transcript_99330/g.206907 Transcript_99330/m.206907 type:complete len:1006 (+) Transcript_99330:164-3181(+)
MAEEKKQKTEEIPAEKKTEEDGADKPHKVEPPVEHEKDAAPIKGATNKEPVQFYTEDTTLNLLPSTNGKLLMSLNEGGIQHLLAGARANVGVKKGRYFFEVKIVEMVPGHSHQEAVGSLRAQHIVRLGFSTAQSSLILGSSADGVAFESDGSFVHNKLKIPTTARFGPEAPLGVLLNLEEGSENYNTISLFKAGRRISKPIALPEALKGKTLFPHVSFKNASLHVNFGSDPLAPLPFTCHMIQGAAKADTEVAKAAPAPKDGKYELAFPVLLPDEGSFAWADKFLEKNPNFSELSDRAILDWADRSSIVRPRGYGVKVSNDKPEYSFQVRELDDGSIQKSIYALAPTLERNFLIMEVKGNLVKEERSKVAAKFPSSRFKKTAYVAVGEPSKDFKQTVQKITLAAKQEASDKRHAAKKEADKKKRAVLKMQKEKEKRKKAAEKLRAKNLAAAKKKMQAVQAAKAAAGKEKEEKDKEEEKTGDAEEKKEEEDEKIEASEPEEEEAVEEPEVDEPAPQVELDDEEKKLWFVKSDVKDLTPVVLSANFANFSLPTKEEGFDAINFEWAKEPKCQEYFKSWITSRKLTMRMDGLVPGEWAKERISSFGKAVGQWRAKTSQAKKAAVASKAKTISAKVEKKEEAKKEDGEEVKEEKEEEAKEMETEDAPADEAEEESDFDFSSIDVFGLEDILDVAKNMTLMKDWLSEDWTLLNLRFELWLLVRAFAKDAKDPERIGIHIDNLPFYYQKYFGKPLNVRDYGVQKNSDLIALVNDAIFVGTNSVLQTMLAQDMETFTVFAKLTEQARRFRKTKIESGDLTVKLQFGSGLQQGFRGAKRSFGQAMTQAKGKGRGKGRPGVLARATALKTTLKPSLTQRLSQQSAVKVMPTKAGVLTPKSLVPLAHRRNLAQKGGSQPQGAMTGKGTQFRAPTAAIAQRPMMMRPRAKGAQKGGGNFGMQQQQQPTMMQPQQQYNAKSAGKGKAPRPQKGAGKIGKLGKGTWGSGGMQKGKGKW